LKYNKVSIIILLLNFVQLSYNQAIVTLNNLTYNQATKRNKRDFQFWSLFFPCIRWCPKDYVTSFRETHSAAK